MPELARLFDAHQARDPTQTIKLRKAFRATAKMRLRQWRSQMRNAVLEHNILGFSRGPSFHPPQVRLQAFSSWLNGVGGQILLGTDWARPYIERAWRVGEAKAIRETGRGAGPDRSEMIAALARVEIEGILGVTSQQVAREAAKVIVRGTPKQRAIRQLFSVFDKLAQPRLVVMCDVLSIKAYNEAKLSSYVASGIRRVGIQAESLPGGRHSHIDAADAAERPAVHELESAGHLVTGVVEELEKLEAQAEEEQLVGILTAGDDKVCQLCEDWAEDSPYEIEEVRDVYPLHPRCRCAVYPWEDLRFKGDSFEDKYNPDQPRDPAGVSTGGQWTAGAAGELWGGVSHEQTVSSKQQAAVKELAEKVPGLKNLLPYLAPDEVNRVKKVNVSKMVEMFTNFPVEAEEMAAVAYSGGAKRGWYRKSAKALLDVFGAVDAPRFAALMAALSPQTGVEDNAVNALNTWVGWVKAGRPTDRAAIVKVMGESVQGEKGAESILPAWINNSVMALSAPDPENIVLSGPKVDSFAYNLRDHVNAVTLNSWMANYIGIKQAMFARRMAVPGKMPGKGPMYIATAAVTRKAAEILTEKTGSQWTPAEVQETIWSWAKTLYERATTDKTTVAQLLEAGSVTHKDIADTPDFAILFTQNVYRKILEAGGYANQAAAIAASGGELDRTAEPRGGLTAAEGSGIPQDAFTRHLFRAAGRLDKLRIERAQRKAEAAEEDGLDFWIHFDSVADYDPDEPRDPEGKWTTGGGGGGGSAGKGYSAAAHVDKHGVIHTSSVFDAQLALSQGRDVELDQPRKVSVLIDRLGAVAADMIKHGEKAPNYNLCGIMIKGESLFCHENQGIPRIKMPQLDKQQTKDFIAHLKDSGYEVTKEKVRSDHLRATQEEISGAKVAEVANKLRTQFGGEVSKRLIVSKDDYVLDGHHHWAAKMGIDYVDGTAKGDTKLKVSRVDISITKLLKLANQFTGGKGAKGTGDQLDMFEDRYNPNEPREPAGTPTGGQWTSGGASSSRGTSSIDHGMIETSPRAFVESRDVSSRQQFLSAHPAEELAKHTLLMNRDGNVGISIDPHGDVQNVFNNGGPKGGAAKAMVAAIENGGRTLDCYDGFLPSYYAQFGFKETQRMKFNPSFAPPGWDFAKYDNPDIVFMAWNGYLDGGAKGAIERAASRANWIKPERTTSYGDDWDAAKSASRAAASGGEIYRRPGEAVGAQAEQHGSPAGFGASEGSRGAVDPGGDDKMLLVSHEPRNTQYRQWATQLKANEAKIEHEGRVGDREDSQIYQMKNALTEYAASTIADRETSRIGLSVVYGGPRESGGTKLLAATLVRLDTKNSIARITLSGGLDEDAHEKSLHMTVARYGKEVDRIEAAAFGDDLETIAIYERAGFRISGQTSTGQARLIYGKEGQTAAELAAAMSLELIRKNEIQAQARVAAASLDFNPDNVKFTDEDRTFKVNGKEMYYAGSYTRGEPNVMIYTKHCDIASTPGITAHEIGHRKLDALRRRYRDEYQAMMAEPGPAPDPNGERWWQKTGGHEAVMAADGTLRAPYDKKYPVYDFWERNVELKRDQLHRDDGVTDYSKEYWQAFDKLEVGIDKPIHETIAEMTRLKYETGKLPGSTDWKNLFHMIDKVWKELPTEKRGEYQEHNGPFW